jgi:hypothetical protein
LHNGPSDEETRYNFAIRKCSKENPQNKTRRRIKKDKDKEDQDKNSQDKDKKDDKDKGEKDKNKTVKTKRIKKPSNKPGDF